MFTVGIVLLIIGIALALLSTAPGLGVFLAVVGAVLLLVSLLASRGREPLP